MFLFSSYQSSLGWDSPGQFRLGCLCCVSRAGKTAPEISGGSAHLPRLCRMQHFVNILHNSILKKLITFYYTHFRRFCQVGERKSIFIEVDF